MVQRTGTLQTFRQVAYRTLFKHNSTGVLFVIGGAIAGEALIHTTLDSMWDSANKGKLAKDVLPKE
eukprot:CAMPEP_0114130970 /NCGR_PEP_ID=MMETSP0043_2-20121206/12301_1 /TAXON_ID=464988 /ORGANISM="Hemiselmis andersenii, Strain CCMP644" /LENGTH=65 /DNA_ID=CAMNT_0001224365 /DNA_START=101 /DNA_END=298 /DNA_ORIENTATION=+